MVLESTVYIKVMNNRILGLIALFLAVTTEANSQIYGYESPVEIETPSVYNMGVLNRYLDAHREHAERSNYMRNEGIKMINTYQDLFSDALKRDDYKNALYYLEKAEEINIKYVGDNEFSKNIAEARSQINKFIQEDEAIADMKYKRDLGSAYLRLGEYEKAKQLFYQSLAIDERLNLGNKQFLEDAIERCEEERKKHTLIDITNTCSFKNGNSPIQRKNITYKATEATDCKIVSITRNSKETVIEIEHHIKDGYWFNISPETYIEDKATGKKYRMTNCEGISRSPEKSYHPNGHGLVKFKLFFPSLPSTVTTIDLIESEESAWRFYNIRVK